MAFSATVEAWRALLEQYAPDLPIGALLAWLAEESDGQACALGSVYEVGIGQLNLVDGPAWGASIATLRAACAAAPSQRQLRELTDDERTLQVTSFIAYVRHALDVAQSELAGVGADWNQSELWSFVKLQHGLPLMPRLFLPAVAQRLGRAPTYPEFRDAVQSMTNAELVAISPTVARYAPLDRFFRNADRVGAGAASSSSSSPTPQLAELALLVALAAAAALCFALL